MKKPSKKKSSEKDLIVTAESRMEAVLEKVSTPEYQNQKYVAGKELTMQSNLFADILNNNSQNAQVLIQIKENLELNVRALQALINAIETRVLQQDVLTTSLAEQHVKNVDNGVTEHFTPEQPKTEEKVEENGK